MQKNIAARFSLVAAIGIATSLTACAGPTGPAGADGADGADGTNGVDGTDGTDGTDGVDGTDGTDGTNGTDGRDAPVDVVVLPGFFAPESINAGADGTLYVASVATGALVTISADGYTLEEALPAETAPAPNNTQVIGKLGVFVDDANSDLWLCTINATTFASTLRRYDLATFAQEAEFPVLAGVCNDIATDSAGNVYITDSFTGIERLPVGGTALELWATDASFTADPGAFAIDGIVIDGDDIYVNNLTSGALIRVAIQENGSAGTPVTISGVTLTSPDGMRLRAPGRILVAEAAADTLSEIAINSADNTGVRSVLSNRLDRPSAVAISGGAAWVAEGQIGRVFQLDNTPLNLPFQVVRLPLF